jgi:hypothetical protein
MTEEVPSVNPKLDVMCKLLKAIHDLQERNKMLEKENAELKKQQFSLRNERNTFLAQNEQYEKDLIDFNENLTKAKEIILRLYNAGRDVLMCRSEEKAYDNLSEAINDSNIEQFLKEIEK